MEGQKEECRLSGSAHPQVRQGPLEDHTHILNGDINGLVFHQLLLASGHGQVADLAAGRTSGSKEGHRGAFPQEGMPSMSLGGVTLLLELL